MKAFFILICFVSILSAQELTPLEIAKKTIAAAGGETWRSPKTLQLSGTATLFWSGKAYKMTTYKMWRVFPSANDDARNANGKVRFDALDGDKIFFRIAFDGKNTLQTLSDEAKELTWRIRKSRVRLPIRSTACSQRSRGKLDSHS